MEHKKQRKLEADGDLLFQRWDLLSAWLTYGLSRQMSPVLRAFAVRRSTLRSKKPAACGEVGLLFA